MKSLPLQAGLTVALLAAISTACTSSGSSRPPAELVDARTAYARAAAGNAARVVPGALEDARRALVIAERRQAEGARSDEVKDLAYVAHRKTLTVEANSRTAMAAAHETYALQTATDLRRRQLTQAQNLAERAEDKEALEERPPAQRRAKAALDRLTPFAAIADAPSSVSGAPGGMVLRLADSVLFEGDGAELMPTARQRLDRVAEALHEVSARSMVVKGFMDRSAGTRPDVDLSRRRADAVRAYLVSRGLPADRMRAEGRGAMEPLSSNASAEGRNGNRRIEILVEGAAAGGDKH